MGHNWGFTYFSICVHYVDSYIPYLHLCGCDVFVILFLVIVSVSTRFKAFGHPREWSHDGAPISNAYRSMPPKQAMKKALTRYLEMASILSPLTIPLQVLDVVMPQRLTSTIFELPQSFSQSMDVVCLEQASNWETNWVQLIEIAILWKVSPPSASIEPSNNYCPRFFAQSPFSMPPYTQLRNGHLQCTINAPQCIAHNSFCSYSLGHARSACGYHQSLQKLGRKAIEWVP